MLPVYLVTCHQRLGKLGQRLFIQTCGKKEIRPIIVTAWNSSGAVGPLELREWKEIQNVSLLRVLDAASAHSVRLKGDRAYFKEGHTSDWINWQLDNLGDYDGATS